MPILLKTLKNSKKTTMFDQIDGQNPFEAIITVLQTFSEGLTGKPKETHEPLPTNLPRDIKS